MKLCLFFLTWIFSFNVLAQAPGCDSCKENGAIPGVLPLGMERLAGVSGERSPDSQNVIIYFSFSLVISQNSKTGVGTASNPIFLENIILKDNTVKSFNANSLKIADNLPLSTKTTEHGGCLLMGGVVRSCTGIRRYSEEINAILGLNVRLEGMDFLREAKLDREQIKRAVLQYTGSEIEAMEISQKEAARIFCTIEEDGSLSCNITLPYQVKIKNKQSH